MRISLLFSALVLMACQSSPDRGSDPSARKFPIPVGSKLVLNQALTIPANTAHLAFQDGKVVPRGSMSQVDQYHVNCRFEVKTLSDTSQQIAADTFDIIKVQDLTTGATGYSTHNFATRLMLSSSAQPDVYQMTCQQWSDASELDYPSIALMEKAWGDAFTLQLRP